MKFKTGPLTNALFGYFVVAVILAIAIFMSFNRRTGPHAQVMGIVQGAAFVQRDGAAIKVVAVRLDNGDVVTARTRPEQIVQPGQKIQLDVYRRVLTGGLTYTMAAGVAQPAH